MLEQLYFPLKLITALGCCLIAGVFFAFSTFVMKALAQQPAAQGMVTMQSINVMVINSWFMATFLGTSGVCLVLIVSSLFQWQLPSAAYSIVGGSIYLIGSFGVTIVFNVPLNNALAIANPNSIEGVNLWAKYLTDWTFWNHVRTIAAFVAATLFTLAIAI